MVQQLLVAPGDRMVRDVVAFACERDGIDVVVLDAVGADIVAFCTEFPRSTVVVGPDFVDGPLEAFLSDMLTYGTAVLLLTDHTNPERVVAFFELGIQGLLYLDSGVGAVAESVRAVQAGGVVLHPWFAATVIGEWRLSRRGSSRPGALTPRERDVLLAMTEGLSTKAIARSLGVAPKTIENHKVRIFSKLGVRNQAQAVGVAITRGLVARFEPVGPAL